MREYEVKLILIIFPLRIRLIQVALLGNCGEMEMTCMCDALGKVALSAITLQARFPSLIHSSGEMAEGAEGGRSGQHFILTKGKAILETRTPKRRGANRRPIAASRLGESFPRRPRSKIEIYDV